MVFVRLVFRVEECYFGMKAIVSIAEDLLVANGLKGGGQCVSQY